MSPHVQDYTDTISWSWSPLSGLCFVVQVSCAREGIAERGECGVYHASRPFTLGARGKRAATDRRHEGAGRGDMKKVLSLSFMT